LLGRFGGGAIDILVGTQMVAKGHDFPNVTLVGVVSADVGLGLADYRAAERTFQLLTQVAGRAGRGAIPGEAIVQTLHPDHYSIRHACSQAYAPFYAEEIEFRRAMRYPPEVSLVSAVVRGTHYRQTMQEAAELVATVRRRPSRFRVLGPASAPIGRLRGQHRVQLFLKGPHRREMREALLSALDGRTELRRRVVVDVDPLWML
jgi:primosomal protein N' (replication factor Y)